MQSVEFHCFLSTFSFTSGGRARFDWSDCITYSTPELETIHIPTTFYQRDDFQAAFVLQSQLFQEGPFIKNVTAEWFRFIKLLPRNMWDWWPNWAVKLITWFVNGPQAIQNLALCRPSTCDKWSALFFIISILCEKGVLN